MDLWADFRSQMPVSREWAYFDHAAVGPIPASARAAVVTWADQAAELGGIAWPIWNRSLGETRKRAAAFLNADPDEVSLSRSTTEGINYVADGYPWKPGDNVVTLENEFPSNLYPWMNLADRGVETRRLSAEDGRVDLRKLADACDSRTRIVAVSWVGYCTGWRLNLDQAVELAHRRGALFFLDAIQGLGAFPLDVRQTPIDFMSSGGQKWMLGGEGTGLFYLKREHLNLLRPMNVGWNTVIRNYEFDHTELNPRPAASRYEGGAANSMGFICFGAALELLHSIGPARIAERILDLTDHACDRLRTIGAEIRSSRESRDSSSGIVMFDVPGKDPMQVRQTCISAQVALACRSGLLRISPHAYLNEEDIERLVDAIQACK